MKKKKVPVRSSQIFDKEKLLLGNGTSSMAPVRKKRRRRRRMKIAGMSELQAQQLELASKTQPWWKKGGETKMSDS